MKKVLITGMSGLIGDLLRDHLGARDGYEPQDSTEAFR